MSHSEEQRTRASPSSENPAACAAQDLKLILQSIADQIADCDRRHLAVLTDMQGRLADLGKGAAEVKAQLPDDVAPALSRVEDRMAQLAGLLADADKDRRSTRDGESAGEQYDGRADASASHYESPVPLDGFAFVDHVDPPALELETGEPAEPHSQPWDPDFTLPSSDEMEPFAADSPSLDPAPLNSEPSLARAGEDFEAHLAEPSPMSSMGPGISDAAAMNTAPTPAPLKSAAGAESLGAFTHRGDFASGQMRGAIDTFDVIGGSGDAALEQPWDHQAAEALVEFYETGDGNLGNALFQDNSGGAEPEPSSVLYSHPAVTTIVSDDPERAWLETRFADIAAKLEQSLAEMRPDHSINELGARFERLEDRLGTVLADAATRADVAGLKSIELHIDQLAAQLEAAQSQFARLDAIEEEIRALAERVSDVRVAEMLGNASPQDVDAVAKAVADRLSAHLPNFPGVDANSADRLDELRSLLQSFIDEKRHGEHQTVTMLDRMQQGMIRLLDRMDVAEGGAHYRIEEHAPHPAVVSPITREQQAPPARYNVPPDLSKHKDRFENVSAAIEGLAASKGGEGPHSDPIPAAQQVIVNAPVEAPRSREDFIAAARKAARQASVQAAADAEMARLNKGSAGSAKYGGRSRLMVAIIALLAVGAGFTVVKAFRGSNAGSAIDQRIEGPGSGPEPGQIEGPRERPELDKILGPSQGSRSSSRHALLDPNIPIGEIGMPGPHPAAPEKASSNMRTGATVTETGSLSTGPGAGVAPEIVDVGVSRLAGSRGTGEMPPVLIGPLSLRLAASQGDPSAEFEVGSRFAEGKGIQQDLKRATVWYQRSAMQGFAPAQFRLATHYERGLGVKADLVRARSWYQRAAEQGHVKAMHNLAVLCASREDGSPDYAAAGRWFGAAAEHGLTDSQFNLAILHESGLGVGRDPKQAYKWYSLAARAGDTEAVRRRDLLKTRLTASEQREVEGQTDSWRARAVDQALNDARVAGEAWKMRTSEARGQ